MALKQKAPKHIWTLIQEFDRSKPAKDGKPQKPWRVERNEQGEIRCSCPSWIFGVRGDPPPRTKCKHTEYVQEHAVERAEQAALEAFASKLADAFITTVSDHRPPVYARRPIAPRDLASALRYATNLIGTSDTIYGKPWMAFAKAVSKLGELKVEVPSYTSAADTGPVLGKRRIILPGD